MVAIHLQDLLILVVAVVVRQLLVLPVQMVDLLEMVEMVQDIRYKMDLLPFIMVAAEAAAVVMRQLLLELVDKVVVVME